MKQEWDLAAILTIATLLGLPIVLMIYEIRRRKHPRVVVRLGFGSLIGIYRFERLQRTVELAQSTILGRHWYVTWAPLLILSIATLTCLIPLVLSPLQLSIGDRLTWLLAAGFYSSLAASIVKTRLRCEICLFQFPSTLGFEHILVPGRAITRIFGLHD